MRLLTTKNELRNNLCCRIRTIKNDNCAGGYETNQLFYVNTFKTKRKGEHLFACVYISMGFVLHNICMVLNKKKTPAFLMPGEFQILLNP